MPQHNIKQVKGATQGSVLFLGTNGVVTENNGKFFWNTTNNALLIRTNTQFGSEALRVNGSQRIDGDLVVAGSFSVLGSASVINTQNLYIQDPIILLAATQAGSPILDSGFFINRGTGATQAFIWDESAKEFAFIQTNDSSAVIGNVNISSYSNFRASGVTVSQVKITSGAASGYILISDSTGLSSWTSSIPNGVTGSGTLNYIPRWLSSTNLSSTGTIYDTGSLLGIGNTSPSAKVEITGTSSALEGFGLKVNDSVGGAVLYARNDGSVGIGGTSIFSTYKLQLILSGANKGIQLIGGGVGTAVLETDTDGSSGSLKLYSSPIGNQAIQFNSLSNSFINTGYNFAIDTTATAKLHVKGSSSSFATYVLKLDNISNNPLLYVTNNGHIGINTSPVSTYQVKIDSTGTSSNGLYVISDYDRAIVGEVVTATGLIAVQGIANAGAGIGVQGISTNGYGVYGQASTGISSYGYASGAGIAAQFEVNNTGALILKGVGVGGSEKFRVNELGQFGINVTPTTLMHISATYAGGGFRLQDTTQAAGYFLVSDANGVGTWTSSIGGGGLSTANNGLTYSGSNVQLGGTLIQDTSISNTVYNFTMSSTSEIALHSTSGAQQISKIATGITATTFEMYDFGGGTGYVNIKLYNTNQTIGDGSTNNQIIITDQQTLKGAAYAGDYSANFTTYSLVTKGYVQSIIGTSSGVTGSGTANYVPYWVTSTQLSSVSSIIDSGTAVGIGTQSNGAYMVNVQGDVNILGTLYATSKSFEITHPLDPNKRLTYGSLEGPEYGVYFRGRLQNNSIIDLPNYWTALVDESTITVNITPIGMHQRIFVDKIENNKVYLGVDNSGLPNCYYIVYAERKDIPKIIVE